MIYQEMVKGFFTEEAQQSCERMVNELQAQGAQGVILGSTELPILLQNSALSNPSFNTTELHAFAAVELARDSSSA